MKRLFDTLLILTTLIWVMALGGCDIGDPAPPTATSTPTIAPVTLTPTGTPGAYPVPSMTPEPYE